MSYLFGGHFLWWDAMLSLKMHGRGVWFCLMRALTLKEEWMGDWRSQGGWEEGWEEELRLECKIKHKK